MSPSHKDYRGFLFVQNEKHGLLLLYCTRKKDKPNHWQLPGGHVDSADFDQARNMNKSGEDVEDNEILWLAAKIGAARELYEETGIDVRSSLDRLRPALRSNTEKGAYKTRRFFSLKVNDADMAQDSPKSIVSMGKGQEEQKLRLSHEHSGFKFQPEVDAAIKELEHHSGGVPCNALKDAKNSPEGGLIFSSKLST